ncbi:hypothetical protein [Paenibacillus methanolicus]|nr:hypothetical protein [Paenibacillus methanolicus]
MSKIKPFFMLACFLLVFSVVAVYLPVGVRHAIALLQSYHEAEMDVSNRGFGGFGLLIVAAIAMIANLTVGNLFLGVIYYLFMIKERNLRIVIIAVALWSWQAVPASL